MAAFRDCEDCGGTGRIYRTECYLCHGTGQCREDSYDDEVQDVILSAPDDVVLAGGLDGLAEGTHYIDRTGAIRPKATQ
jgi:Ribonuclease G/E